MTKNELKWVIETLEERLAYFGRMATTYDDRAKNMLMDDALRRNLENAREYVRGKMVATDEAIKVVKRYM